MATRSAAIIALARTACLWHTPDYVGYATIQRKAEGKAWKENWPIESKAFRRWLNSEYYLRTRKAPSSHAMDEAIAALLANANYNGETLPASVRVTATDEAHYLDLADPLWSVVKITADGWKWKNPRLVKFCRPHGMQTLPVPRRCGSLEELRPFLNLTSGSDWILLVGWLLMAMNPFGPYPILVLHGSAGSAKSTTSRLLKSLIDANSAPIRALPGNERDLAIAAANSHVLAFDNLSHLRRPMSDALCRLATGGGLATRKLYEDNTEFLFYAKRPIISNGITEVVTQSDLLDRSLVLHLPDIPPRERRLERELSGTFAAAIPGILGALLDAHSVAIRNLPTVHLDSLPRMADFVHWVTAAEPALGWRTGTFIGCI